MINKKKCLDTLFCSLIVSFSLFLFWFYLNETVSNGKIPFFGFGYIILCPYLLVVVYSGLCGLKMGLIVFMESFFLFFIYCFVLTIYNHGKISVIGFIKTQLLFSFSLISLISLIIAGLISTFWRRPKVAVFSSITVFYGLIILSTFFGK